MQTANIIERAFELARSSTSVEEVRKALRQEGYSNVDAHLAGASIKADLKKKFIARAPGVAIGAPRA
jgi:tRNA G26 N,N-dimethylase Trm1